MMVKMERSGRPAALAMLALNGLALTAADAGAQATPPLQTIPGLDNFTIERPRPAPTPTPVQTPRPSGVPIPPGSPVIILPPARPTPLPAAASTPRARPTPTPVPTTAPTPQPSPSEQPTPLTTPTPAATAPIPVARPEAPPAARSDGAGGRPWILVAALAALGIAAVFLLRRRRAGQPAMTEQADDTIPVVPAASPRRAPPPAPAPATRLAITLRPVRAGLNLLSATAECEVTVLNAGEQPVTDVRVGLHLLNSGIGQEADLAAAFAQPIVRPAAPPFALQPGEERRVRGVVALPRDAIRPMAAGGRPMFVPLVAVNLLYTGGGVPAQTAQAFAIGVERVDSAKLAPFWLDGPPRMHDAVAARPHAVAIER